MYALRGFKPVDRQLGTEVYPLTRYETGSVDEIRASHIFEHFSFREACGVLKEWARVLKPGGKIRIAVPDLEWIAKEYLNGTTSRPLLMGYLMGGQTDANDFHYAAYDRKTLTAMMRDAGFESIADWKSDIQDCSTEPCSLNLEGIKMETPPVKVVGLLSLGRMAFTDNIFCAFRAFTPLGIDLRQLTCPYWHFSLANGMLDAMDDGADIIITLDHDSIFDSGHVEHLLQIMAECPWVDALASLQSRRGSNAPALFVRKEEDGELKINLEPDERDDRVSKVNLAHFGLTAIRVSSLRKLPLPWFKAIPREDGTWRRGATHPDIDFWREWEAAGLGVFIANRCRIGQIQNVATYPDSLCNPSHTSVETGEFVGV
jgi:hypothetical protein